MRPRLLPPVLGVLLLTAAAGSAVAEPVTDLLELGGPLPQLVAGLGDPADLVAVALSPDRSRAAGALPSADRERRSIVRLVDAGETGTVDLEIPGQIRDLVFDRDGGQLLVLMHRPAKRAPGDCWLVRIEVDSLKARKELRLPPTASALTLASWDNLLLVAAEDALRTFRLPELRSGPLYRIPGRNTAVAALPRGARVLLGQADRIVLVDLTDRPGRDGSPTRSAVPSPAPVTGLAVSEDGTRGAARLEDASLLPFWLAPLRLEEPAPQPAAPEPPPVAAPQRQPETLPQPEAVAEPEPEPAELPQTEAVAEPEPAPETQPTAPEPEAPPEPAELPQTETGAEPEPAPETQPTAPETEAPPEPAPAELPQTEAGAEPQPAPEPQPTAPETEAPPEPAPAELPQAEAGAEPEPAPETQPTAPEPEARPGPETQPAAPEPSSQLSGAVEGPAAGEVREILVLGPDSVVRIARRLTPDASGRWSTAGLPPGRYRIQPLAEAGGQLVCDPPFVVVQLEDSSPVITPTIRILRAL